MQFCSILVWGKWKVFPLLEIRNWIKFIQYEMTISWNSISCCITIFNESAHGVIILFPPFSYISTWFLMEWDGEWIIFYFTNYSKEILSFFAFMTCPIAKKCTFKKEAGRVYMIFLIFCRTFIKLRNLQKWNCFRSWNLIRAFSSCKL